LRTTFEEGTGSFFTFYGFSEDSFKGVPAFFCVDAAFFYADAVFFLGVATFANTIS
jgi:hypothetical protein